MGRLQLFGHSGGLSVLETSDCDKYEGKVHWMVFLVPPGAPMDGRRSVMGIGTTQQSNDC